jgi:hypothetical protein
VGPFPRDRPGKGSWDDPKPGCSLATRFTHRGLPSEDARKSHAHGWDHYLDRLAIGAAGDDPGPDPWKTGEMT